MPARALPLLIALLAAGAAGFAPIPPPKPAKDKAPGLKELEGTWTVVKYESGNPKAGALLTMFKSISIKGNTWTQHRAAKAKGAEESYTFTLDTKHSPVRIDMTRDNPKVKAK